MERLPPSIFVNFSQTEMGSEKDLFLAEEHNPSRLDVSSIVTIGVAVGMVVVILFVCTAMGQTDQGSPGTGNTSPDQLSSATAALSSHQQDRPGPSTRNPTMSIEMHSLTHIEDAAPRELSDEDSDAINSKVVSPFGYKNQPS